MMEKQRTEKIYHPPLIIDNGKDTADKNTTSVKDEEDREQKCTIIASTIKLTTATVNKYNVNFSKRSNFVKHLKNYRTNIGFPKCK